MAFGIELNINDYKFTVDYGGYSMGGLIVDPFMLEKVDYMRAVERAEIVCKTIHPVCMYKAYMTGYDWENEMNLPTDWQSRLESVRSYVEPYDFADLWNYCNPPTKPPVEKPKAIKLSTSGYVYLLQSPTGFWKIGKSVNPDNRMETFTVKLPFEVEYKHLIPCQDYSKAERELHERYAHRRGEGEWFALSDEDVREICKIEEM